MNNSLMGQIVSFEAGITTLRGRWVAMGIKFATADGMAVLTHWRPELFKQLTDALLNFYLAIGFNSLAFRARSDPALEASLGADHPYHLLLSRRPALTEDETGTITKQSGIEALSTQVSEGLSLSMTTSSGSTLKFSMHEYTAVSLYGYLQEYLEAADRLSRPAAGSA